MAGKHGASFRRVEREALEMSLATGAPIADHCAFTSLGVKLSNKTRLK